MKNKYSTHNNIPKMTGKNNKQNYTPKKDKNKKQGNKNKPISEFERLIDNFSDLLTNATINSVYFMDKEVLNSLSGISTETFQMEKFIKINEFCKEVENLEMEVAKIQNFQAIKKQQNLKGNNGNIDDKLQDKGDDVNYSVLKMASERRINVYDYFFESIKENLGDIQYISTELKDIKKSTLKHQTTNILKDVLNTSNNLEESASPYQPSDNYLKTQNSHNSHDSQNSQNSQNFKNSEISHNSKIDFQNKFQDNFQNNFQDNFQTKFQTNYENNFKSALRSNYINNYQNNTEIIKVESLSDHDEESEQSEILKNNSDYHNDSIVYSNIVKSKLEDSDLLNDQGSSSNDVTFIDLEHVEANEEKNEKLRVAETSVRNASLTKSFRQYKKQDTIKDFLFHLDQEDVHTSVDKTVIYQYCSGDANTSLFMLDK
jgi:hypothetical protein